MSLRCRALRVLRQIVFDPIQCRLQGNPHTGNHRRLGGAGEPAQSSPDGFRIGRDPGVSRRAAAQAEHVNDAGGRFVLAEQLLAGTPSETVDRHPGMRRNGAAARASTAFARAGPDITERIVYRIAHRATETSSVRHLPAFRSPAPAPCRQTMALHSPIKPAVAALLWRHPARRSRS